MTNIFNSPYEGMPSAGPMPEQALSSAENSYSAKPNYASTVGGMDDYPAGRGGMLSAAMPGSLHGSNFYPTPLIPIGAMPEPINMTELLRDPAKSKE